MFCLGKRLDEAIVLTLTTICRFLEKEKMPYLFDRHCNIFWKTSSDDLICMRKKIIKDIERIQSEGVAQWRNLLIKKLPLVDDQFYVNRGSISGKAEAWKSHKKRNSVYQQTKQEHGDDPRLQNARICHPNRVVKGKMKEIRNTSHYVRISSGPSSDSDGG